MNGERKEKPDDSDECLVKCNDRAGQEVLYRTVDGKYFLEIGDSQLVWLSDHETVQWCVKRLIPSPRLRSALHGALRDNPAPELAKYLARI